VTLYFLFFLVSVSYIKTEAHIVSGVLWREGISASVRQFSKNGQYSRLRINFTH